MRGLFQPRQVCLGVLSVGLGAVGVGLDESVTDDLHVGFGVLDAHPQMGVDLTMNVRAENGLGQLVDGVARVAQESERRSRWDFGECLRGHPHHRLVGAETLLGADATASWIGQDDHLALVDVGGEVRVALVDDRPIGEFGDRAWISSDGNRQGLGADGGVSLGRGQGGREGRLVDTRLAERP